jgi:6-phosphogluconolactonase (cycloisomerase 2 family)
MGLMLIAALATMGLSGCGHYTCGATFGSSTCATGTVSLSGGGGGSAAAAYVYLINGSGSPGSLVSYTLNTASAPPAFSFTANYTAPTTPGADAGMGMALAQSKFLYAAFGSTQQIYGWSIGTTGSLTPVPSSPIAQGLITQFSATEFDTQRVITNPAGTLLFIADQFSAQIFVYQIGTDGSLTAAANSPFTVAFPAGNMTTDGLGKYLYFSDSSGGHTGTQIAAYSIGTGTGSASGALTPVAGSPFAGTNFNMWQVEGDPTGQYLIGTTGVDSSVDDNLYVFSIASSTGALSAPVLYPTTNPPVNIAVQTNTGGNLIYTLGMNSGGTGFNPVEGYQLTTGVLTTVSGSPFAAAGVGDSAKFDQSGGLLFVYGGLFNTKTVVFTLTALDVSSGNLTTPTPMEAYGGYFVATDAP